MSQAAIERDHLRFHQALVDKREASGLTQAEIRESLGVCKSTYIHWEKGRILPRPDKYHRLANYLGVTMDELVDMMQGDQN